MAKDYTKRSMRQSKKAYRLSHVYWLLGGFFLGLAMMSWLLPKTRSTFRHLPRIQFTEITKQNMTEQPFKPPQPRFDFYNLLPQDTSNPVLDKWAVTEPKVTATSNVTRESISGFDSNERSILVSQPNANGLKDDVRQGVTVQHKKDDNNLLQQKMASREHIQDVNNSPPPLTTQAELNSQQIRVSIEKQLEAELAETAPASVILVLATFKEPIRANQFQATLLSQGIKAQIGLLHLSDKTLYQVYLGPYLSLATAKQQQRWLQTFQIESRLIKQT